MIRQKAGPSVMELRVIDVGYLEGGSQEVGTSHPHLLSLDVENLTSAPHREERSTASIHLGSVSGHQVQVGSHNNQTSNISFAEVVKQVAETGDANAKGLMRQLLENNTVAAMVGAGAASLLSALGR